MDIGPLTKVSPRENNNQLVDYLNQNNSPNSGYKWVY